MAEKLTQADYKKIREYLDRSEKLMDAQPEKISSKEWDYIMQQIHDTGEIPPEYQGRVSAHPTLVHSRIIDGEYHVLDEPEEQIGYSDVAWDQWLSEATALDGEYKELILKAFYYAMDADIGNARDPVTTVVEILHTLVDNLSDPAAIEGQTSLFDHQEDEPSETSEAEPKEAEPSPLDVRRAAEESGALMSIGGRVASYTAKELLAALTGFSVMRLPDMQNKDALFDDTGRLNPLLLDDSSLTAQIALDTPFFMAINQAVQLAPEDESTSISIYLPQFLRDLGIDPRSYSAKRALEPAATMQELRLQAFMDRLMPFDPFVGRTPDGSFYRALAFESYERKSETVTVNTPYLFKLRNYRRLKEAELGRPQLNQLFYGDIANEPNKAAVELANRILSGIETRGSRADYMTYGSATAPVKAKTVTVKDSNGNTRTTRTEYQKQDDPVDMIPPDEKRKVTWNPRFSYLIAECPQLAAELKAIEERKDKGKYQAYNSKLKQTFEAAYRIIMTKSDAPRKYKKFTLPQAGKAKKTRKGEYVEAYLVPTKSTLSKRLTITHEGKNADYNG